MKFVEDMNFFIRFDRRDFTHERRAAVDHLQSQLDDHDLAETTPDDVSRVLQRVNPRKASGLDNNCGCVLKECHTQLGAVFSILFNWSLK